MKNVIPLLFLRSLAFAAVPAVSNVTVSQDSSSLGVVIGYDLENSPAIVTMDITTNGVSIGGAALRTVGGAVNTYVPQGAGRRIYWAADKDWPGRWKDDGSMKVVLTAYPLDNPPLYMVCDLDVVNGVSYYPSEDSLPFPVSDDAYKTSLLLMKRMNSANLVFRMGAAKNMNGSFEPDADMDGNDGDVCPPHQVSLSKDYYVGVYEITQRQYWYITGGYSGGQTPSLFYYENSVVSASDVPMRPVENVSFKDLRGTTDQDDSPYRWPQDGHAVSPDSAIGKLRSLTGIGTFDLPTEAQWEFACRAGTVTGLNNGKESDAGESVVSSVAWYGKIASEDTGCTVPVGSLLPNAFGLYDMHGNVWEMCLDRYSEGDAYRSTFAAGWENGAVTVDPVGCATGTNTVLRGGGYLWGAGYMRSGYRFSLSKFGRAFSDKYYGFRVVCGTDHR